MKSLKKGLIASAFVALAISQSCKTTEKKNASLCIQGKVLNSKSKQITFKQVGTNVRYVDSLDSEGNFDLTIDNLTEGYFWFGNYHNDFLYLKAGDTTQLIIDEENYDSIIEISGDFEKENNYILASERIKQWPGNTRPDSVVLLEIDSIMKVKRELLANTKDLSDEFIELEELRLFSDSMQRYLTHKSWRGFKREELSFLKDIDVNKHVQFPHSVSDFVLNSLTQIKVEPDSINIVPNSFSMSVDFVREKVKQVNTLIDNPVNRDVILFQAMSYLIRGVELGKDTLFKEVYDKGVRSISDESLVDKLNKKLKTKIGLTKGSEHPEISFKDEKGNVVKTTDERFKNKTIYINVWASWCSPCKPVFRESSSFSEQFNESDNKEVIFLTLYDDNKGDEHEWRKLVEKCHSDEKIIHGIVQDDMKNALKANYLMSGHPRFILIDKEGKIIDADAPSPSDKEKIEKLIAGGL